jgi:hypothetical protein
MVECPNSHAQDPRAQTASSAFLGSSGSTVPSSGESAHEEKMWMFVQIIDASTLPYLPQPGMGCNTQSSVKNVKRTPQNMMTYVYFMVCRGMVHVHMGMVTALTDSGECLCQKLA